MDYLYGEFTKEQIAEAVRLMHSDIHKLLVYKDKNVEESIFSTDEEFVIFFDKLLFRFGGLNSLLGEPPQFVSLMSTLRGAYNEVTKKHFSYWKFRKAILDCHGYLKAIFEIEEE